VWDSADGPFDAAAHGKVRPGDILVWDSPAPRANGTRAPGHQALIADTWTHVTTADESSTTATHEALPEGATTEPDLESLAVYQTGGRGVTPGLYQDWPVQKNKRRAAIYRITEINEARMLALFGSAQGYRQLVRAAFDRALFLRPAAP